MAFQCIQFEVEPEFGLVSSTTLEASNFNLSDLDTVESPLLFQTSTAKSEPTTSPNGLYSRDEEGESAWIQGASLNGNEFGTRANGTQIDSHYNAPLLQYRNPDLTQSTDSPFYLQQQCVDFPNELDVLAGMEESRVEDLWHENIVIGKHEEMNTTIQNFESLIFWQSLHHILFQSLYVLTLWSAMHKLWWLTYILTMMWWLF